MLFKETVKSAERQSRHLYKFSLCFEVQRNVSIQEPHFICKGPLTPGVDAKGYYVTTGIGPVIKENSRKAIRYMIEHLVANYGLTREKAYILCSLVVDLKISEIVSAHSVGSAYLPLSIFSD